MFRNLLVTSCLCLSLAGFSLVAAPAEARQPGQSPIPKEWGAAGTPIFDCAATNLAIDRLERGLPLQEEWIRRTEKQLEDAEKGIEKTKEEMKHAALEAVQDFAKSQLTSTKALRERIAAMKPLLPNGAINPNGMTDVARRAWLERLDHIDYTAELFKKAGEGFDWGKALHDSKSDWDKLSDFLSESGVGKEAVGVGMKALLGPEVGEMATQAIFVSGQAVYLGASAYIDSSDAKQLKDNLDKLKAAHANTLTKIDNYKEIANGPCAPNATTQAPPDSPKPVPPKEMQPPPPSPSPKPVNQHQGLSTGAKVGLTMGVLGGAAVVTGVAVGNALTKDTTDTSSSCLSSKSSAISALQNADTICSGPATNQVIIACNQASSTAAGAVTSYCSCLGKTSTATTSTSDQQEIANINNGTACR
jgi:hypothetical protein